jgi:cell division protein FtsB
MTCEKCGKTYWTKECLNCKEDKKENKYIFSALIIALISMIGLGSYIGYEEYTKYENYTKELQAQIEQLKNENGVLKRREEHIERINKSFQQENINLVHENRRLKNNSQSQITQNNIRTIKPNKQNSTQNIYSNNTRTKNQTTTNYIPYKPVKKYQSFSNSIKLVSDSRIIKKSDNRLESSAPIYGRYYPIMGIKEVHGINCNLKENIYNVEDECSMRIALSGDKIYTSKMRAKDFENFNKDRYMIECDYSKEHGIMHNCSLKLRS